MRRSQEGETTVDRNHGNHHFNLFVLNTSTGSLAAADLLKPDIRVADEGETLQKLFSGSHIVVLVLQAR